MELNVQKPSPAPTSGFRNHGNSFSSISGHPSRGYSMVVCMLLRSISKKINKINSKFSILFIYDQSHFSGSNLTPALKRRLVGFLFEGPDSKSFLGHMASCHGYLTMQCENSHQFSSVQSLSHVRLFATPWFTAHQASLSITNSQSSVKLTSIESVMPSSHLILCRPLLLLPPIPPSIRVFSNESTLHMRWPKYWSFSFSIIPSKEHPGLISFIMDWLDLLAVQGTLKESSPTLQFKSINSSVLSFIHSPTLTSTHDHWKNHSLD